MIELTATWVCIQFWQSEFPRRCWLLLHLVKQPNVCCWSSTLIPIKEITVFEHWTASNDSNYRPVLTSYAPHLCASITRAVESQQKIGWDNALNGFLSCERVAGSRISWHERSPRRFGGESERSSSKSNVRYLWLYSSHMGTLEWDPPSNRIECTCRFHPVRNYRGDKALSFSPASTHVWWSTLACLCERSLTKLLIDGSSATQRCWVRMVKRSIGISRQEGTTQTKMTSFFARRI